MSSALYLRKDLFTLRGVTKLRLHSGITIVLMAVYLRPLLK